MSILSTLSRLSFDRPIMSYSKVQLAYSRLIRGREVHISRGAIRGKHHLNIGCGPYPIQGFINLDYHWRPGVDICWDITRALPLDDASVRGVFTEHCVEHVPFDACRRVLRECARILEPGGALRVVVPDAELYLDLYQRAKAGEEVEFPYPQADEVTPLMAVNRIFRNHGHLFAYDERTLSTMLRDAGLVDIRRASFREGRDPALLVDREERAVESLYMEASAPGR
jgi:predicted SAM-dependent methyltransferase